MNKTTRIILITSSLVIGGCLTFGILAFGIMIEPEEFDAYRALFAFVAGAAFASPLWLPALIPSRFKILSAIFRWLGAIGLLYPIYLFSSSIINFIDRFVSSHGPSIEGLILGLIIIGFCTLSIGVLIWPELKRLLPNPPIKRDA